MLCNHSNGDLFMCKDNMLFSHVEISCFLTKAHLVFHWCLYNKLCYVRMYVMLCYVMLSYDPYSPVSVFFAKPLMKVPYEGRAHLREGGRKKLYGPTTKAYGLAC